MATRPIEIGPAGIRTARNIERLRLLHGLTQHRLAERCAALGRPMTNTTLSRTERARRRCDVDDLVAIAAALGVSPVALLQPLPAQEDSAASKPNSVRREG
ncbi:helix-turn-helix domain-containing protein [Streptomyces noursei]|uniref:helix-turn-helix domain-containing protein n=1 Tax=Streptomyces noursei TaxID=1971 RepID=UPI0038102CCC